MEFSVEYHRSLSKVTVAFAELNEFRVLAEYNPSATGFSIVELRTISIDDNGFFRQGEEPLLV